MSITLTPITKGMENGPEKIMANLNTLLAAIPDDSGWVDASSNVAAPFTVASGFYCKYRRIGSIVLLQGVLTPTRDVAANNNAQHLIENLPFSLAGQQSHEQPGTNGGFWVLATGGNAFTFSRYMYAKADLVPSVCKAGYSLMLGGAFVIDE
ncbi:hypothetical protein [Lacticaseibacillus hulanensis]|uniref:hypothetical protein n=1 Tax=Lacticaseibacillus hulanensis TaxID=2493111 RepID=UPI000FD9855E|nr:hypothetical protein [Lacticaseibacillus hulanensis]